MAENSLKTQTVDAESEGVRIDKWLSQWEGISSRSRAAFLIDSDLVRVNAKPIKASHVVKAGEVVTVQFPDSSPSKIKPYAFHLDILFEDADVIVVDKPSGLVVHPAAGHAEDTLVNALMSHTKDLSMGFGENRPGIVHRLDKETSGLLVVAKNDAAQAVLVEQFKKRSIHRLYQAVCYGDLKKPDGRIESWVARHPTNRKRYASLLNEDDHKIYRGKEPLSEVGKWAATQFRKIGMRHDMSFVELRLETGRTHQIRIHMSEIGHPLVGDLLYGTDRRVMTIGSHSVREQIKNLNRFLLHARELGFDHPRTGQRLMFKTPWPDPARGLLAQWGFE